MADAKKLWLTRPLEDSESFAEDIAKHGIDTLVGPVMRITPTAFSLPRELPQALIVTSRNATHALGTMPPTWRNLPVYCVGSVTADCAREMGFSRIIPGTSDVMALLPRVMRDMDSSATIVYLAGEETRVDVAALMGARGYHVIKLTVYRAIAESTLSEQQHHALVSGQLGGVCFFSPRAALITNGLIHDANLVAAAQQIEAFCFSLDIAKAAGTVPWKQIHACHRPTRDAMRELVISKWPQAR